MILVTGAGGKTGSTLIKTLSTIESVCAFVLREEQISEVEALGAHKAIAGDLRDASAIRSAMKGVRSVYHICPNMHAEELAIGRLVIGEARNSGAEHFVYHSVLHPQTEKMPHHWQKLRVEEALLEAGPFTILQPAPYMQNLLASWKRILADGFLRVPYSVDRKFSFVDLEDVAQAASRVLTGPHHINATYELVGTLPMSHAQVAETLGRVLGRDIRARRQEIEEWKAGAASTSENAIDRLVGMFDYYDQWGLTGNPNVLRWLLKREPVSLEAFFERMVQESNPAG